MAIPSGPCGQIDIGPCARRARPDTYEEDGRQTLLLIRLPLRPEQQPPRLAPSTQAPVNLAKSLRSPLAPACLGRLAARPTLLRDRLCAPLGPAGPKPRNGSATLGSERCKCQSRFACPWRQASAARCMVGSAIIRAVTWHHSMISGLPEVATRRRDIRKMDGAPALTHVKCPKFPSTAWRAAPATPPFLPNGRRRWSPQARPSGLRAGARWRGEWGASI
jgi:hypothetical protein